MLTLPEIFSDQMVLQRRKPVCIWGKASQNGTITLGTCRVAFECRDDAFEAYLPAMEAENGLTLTITAGKDSIQLVDISVGEVFFAGGQSNMELSLEATGCKKPQPDNRLRFFTEPHTMAYDDDSQTEQINRQNGFWFATDGNQEKAVTAIGYYFAKELVQHIDCIIGILSCSTGASRVDAWMSPFWLHSLDLDQYLTHVHLDRDTYKFNLNHWLYFHKYHPVSRYTVRSVLWYQGESNRGIEEARYYDKLLAGMIANWRADNRTPKLPFVLVQLMPYNESESTGDWYHIRKAQELLSKTMSDVSMVTLHESGEREEIHPLDKQPVGIALANAIRANCFGESVEYSGPILDSWYIEDHTIVLCFSHANGLAFDGEPRDFNFCSSDGETPAKAAISGNRIIVEYPAHEQQLRLGWRNAPRHNLYNSAGYLASPFQLELI